MVKVDKNNKIGVDLVVLVGQVIVVDSVGWLWVLVCSRFSSMVLCDVVIS